MITLASLFFYWLIIVGHVVNSVNRSCSFLLFLLMRQQMPSNLTCISVFNV